MATISRLSRHRQKQETRRILLETALRLFDAHGFAHVTTEQIATEAGVTQRTFFRHFPSKEAAVYGDQEEALARLRELLARRPQDEPPFLAIREAILSLAMEYEHQRDLNLVRLRIADNAPSVNAYGRSTIEQAWEATLADALVRRAGSEAGQDLEIHILASAAVSALRTAVEHWVADGAETSLRGLTARSLDFLATDFATLGR